MDQHADTGTWIRTECATGDLLEVRKRLYTLANKAGYSLRTETETQGAIAVLRFLVRRQTKREATP